LELAEAYYSVKKHSMAEFLLQYLSWLVESTCALGFSSRLNTCDDEEKGDVIMSGALGGMCREQPSATSGIIFINGVIAGHKVFRVIWVQTEARQKPVETDKGRMNGWGV